MAVGLGLGLASLPPSRSEPADPGAAGFGRWETLVTRCRLQWPSGGSNPEGPSGCLTLRLDQTIEGMLRVRFISGTPGSRLASEELSFAGLLLSQDQPMRCQAGSCQPSWPLRLVVQGVASRRFDSRGLAIQLPNNQLARGQCQLDAQQVSCNAENRLGLRWQAGARLIASGPQSPLQRSGR